MCQLTFVNLHNADLNANFLRTQALINTITSHQDGIGIYGTDVVKFLDNPWDSREYSVGIEKVKTSDPMFMHVRLASTTLKNKLIDVEHAHPFKSENFIFAHNGTLEFRKTEMENEKRFENMIDSQKFLVILDEEYNKLKGSDTKNIVAVAIKNAMEQFYGKFAFLLKDLNTGFFYASRGTSANLSWYDINILDSSNTVVESGYVINTDKSDLEKNLYFFDGYLNSIGLHINIDEIKSKPKVTNAEQTIILQKFGATCLGEVKEEKRAYTTTGVVGDPFNHGDYGNYYRNGRLLPEPKKVEISSEESFAALLNGFCETWYVTPSYLDWLSVLLYGKSLLSLDANDWAGFGRKLFLLDSKRSKMHTAIWTKIMDKLYTEGEIYKNFDLSMPYFLDSKKLQNCWREVKNIKEDK